MKKNLVGNVRYSKRRKNIYYDTDGIRENQEETVRICDDCGGLVMIDSVADTGNRIFAVIIPRMSCPDCRQHGEEIYALTNKREYNHIYFQDKDKDIFLTESKG
jgi:hypothetical protein